MTETNRAASASPKLRTYRCHKIVRAAKVVRATLDDNTLAFTFKLDSGDEVQPNKMPHGFNPVGGYFVAYEDGYTSWSPAKAFEEGYSLIPEDHRGRVRLEKAELDARLKKLLNFTESKPYKDVSPTEQRLLLEQATAMQRLSEILASRIAAFT